MQRVAAIVLGTSLLLTGCGGVDDDAPAPTAGGDGAAPAGPSQPAPDEAGVEAYDLDSACDLLGVADVEIAAGGMGWGAVTEEPALCVYQNPDATHTVTLTVTSLAAYDDFDGEGVSAGASGMLALPDGDTYVQVWAPAGAASAVVLSQAPAVLSADAMLALIETAAITLENAPLAQDADTTTRGDGAAGTDGGTLTSGLASVSIEGSIPATGNSIGIDVTAERVAEASAPAFTAIACVGGSGDEGPAGNYAVLAMDGGIADGLRLAQLEITEEYAGPGTYAAAVSFVEADGDSFDLTGTMTVAASGDEGTFDVQDRSGAQVLGLWRCEFVG